MGRQTWDETWWAVASAIAGRAACERRAVGAVIVSADNRDHWVGYNGAPGGFVSPSGALGSHGCSNYCPQGSGDPEAGPGLPCVAIHAEVNALMQSDRALRLGGTIYVTAAPCWKCALAIANSGVGRLVCPRWEGDRLQLASDVRSVFRATRSIRIDHMEEQC